MAEGESAGREPEKRMSNERERSRSEPRVGILKQQSAQDAPPTRRPSFQEPPHRTLKGEGSGESDGTDIMEFLSKRLDESQERLRASQKEETERIITAVGTRVQKLERKVDGVEKEQKEASRRITELERKSEDFAKTVDELRKKLGEGDVKSSILRSRSEGARRPPDAFDPTIVRLSSTNLVGKEKVWPLAIELLERA